MLGLNLGGKTYPWLSAPVLTLFAAALVIGAGFVWRLLTAPEPLIPIAILTDPIVRWSVLANSFGWSAIIGLNIFLPMYLQSVIGFSPTTAGLSLMVLMMSLNSSAGLCGQVLGRVTHYKIPPMVMMVIAWRRGAAGAVGRPHDALSFEVPLFLIGAGFQAVPSLCTVASERGRAPSAGIAVGTLSFARNLFATMLIALLGVIVLAVTTRWRQAGRRVWRHAPRLPPRPRGVPPGVHRGCGLFCGRFRGTDSHRGKPLRSGEVRGES
jgi:hypothetical protein